MKIERTIQVLLTMESGRVKTRWLSKRAAHLKLLHKRLETMPKKYIPDVWNNR